MDPILTIPFAFPGLDNVRCVFTTRNGGASRVPYLGANLSLDVGDKHAAVLRNRAWLQQREGFEDWAENRQVHGEAVRFDPEATPFDVPGEEEADGLATNRPGRALAVKTADCQPVMLAHVSGRAVAALHVGWRGNRMNFPASGVRAFCQRYGFEPSEILAVRGPSLGPAAAEFVNFATDFGPGFEDYYDPATRAVHLWRLTRDQLAGAGVRPENIYGLDLCVYSLQELFFSYRREKTTGRQMALVWLE